MGATENYLDRMIANLPLFVIPVALLLVVLTWGVMYGVFRESYSARPRRQAMSLHGGRNIPLVAAFAGWKGIPWICWASSNLRPRLVLHDDYLEFQVIRSRTAFYADISNVDYRRTVWTENVIIEFTGSMTSFAANTADRSVAREAIGFLSEKGCPLSKRAREVISQR